MALFYLDRTRFQEKAIKRTWLLLKGWTDSEVLKRINSERARGGYSQGRIVEDKVLRPSIEEVISAPSAQPDVPCEEASEHDDVNVEEPPTRTDGRENRDDGVHSRDEDLKKLGEL